MSITNVATLLDHSVSQVLETMCFSEAVPVSETFTRDEAIGTTVAFKGSLSGQLSLEFIEATAAQLSAAFLGLEELPADSTTTAEVVGELGNVICGRMISIFDPCADVSIQPPAKADGPASGQHWRTFRSDAGLLRIAVRFD